MNDAPLVDEEQDTCFVPSKIDEAGKQQWIEIWHIDKWLKMYQERIEQEEQAAAMVPAVFIALQGLGVHTE